MHFEINTKDPLCRKMDVSAIFCELTCLTSEVVVAARRGWTSMTHLSKCFKLTCLLVSCLCSAQSLPQRRHLKDAPEDFDDLNNSSLTVNAVTVDVKLQASSDNLHAQSRSQYFAICVSAKDQHEDISEWIEYHEQLGAGKIYLYDDSSSPPMLGRLKSYIQSGLVEYHFIGQSNHSSIARPQLYVYDQCITRYRSLHQFIAFIDVDEFLFLRDLKVADMPALLHDYEEYGGLAVNWVQFGSSGHVHRPRGGTLANFWKCIPLQHPENLHIKTIANTLYVDRATGDPHHFSYLQGKVAVNEKYMPAEGSRTMTNEISRVALYHYVTKSLDEYQSKIDRGSAMKNFKTMEFFENVEREAVEECREGMQWANNRGLHIGTQEQ